MPPFFRRFTTLLLISLLILFIVMVLLSSCTKHVQTVCGTVMAKKANKLIIQPNDGSPKIGVNVAYSIYVNTAVGNSGCY